MTSGGVLIFEALLDTGAAGVTRPPHPEYRLLPNELLHAFVDLRILYYRETLFNGKGALTAASVAMKP